MNIVFDLDGTLIDSAPDIQAAANAVLAESGHPGLSLEETRSFIGEGSAVLIAKMMDARDIDDSPEAHAQLYQSFLSVYEGAVDKAVFYPGVLETLEALRAGGHRLGLCTNKPEGPARAVLAHMELAPFFTSVVAGGMVKPRKPAPDMLLRVYAELGEGPRLYIGDSEIDAETSQRAGVPFALYTNGYRKAALEEIPHDWAFDDFTHLHAIVEQANGAAYT